MKPDLRWQLLLATVGMLLVLSLLSFQVQTTNLCELVVPAAGGTFSEGMVGLPQTLNPLLHDRNPVDQQINNLLFDGLTRYDEAGRLVPALATGWHVSEDGLTVRFSLRTDIIWHDGTPFTAQDVAFTYGLLQDPAFPGPASLRALWQTVSIVVEGDDQIAFTLPVAYPPFLDATTRGILPSHLLSNVPIGELATHSFNQAPIGTGPFRVESANWLETGRLRLIPNLSYWRQDVQVDVVELRFFSDSQSLFAAYLDGEVHAVHGSSAADAPRIAALDNIRFYAATTPRFSQLIFNFDSEEPAGAADLAVRRALAMGLDVGAVIDEAVSGQGIPFSGPYLPTASVYDPTITNFTYNVISATEQLAAAGYVKLENGGWQNEDGAVVAIQLLGTDDAAARSMVASMAAQWEAFGIEVTTTLLPLPEYRVALADGGFDVALVAINPAGDPDLYDFWSQEAIIRGQNYGHWNNRRASEALETARQTWDQEERAIAYRSFLRQYHNDLPALTLFQYVTSYGITDEINAVDIGRIHQPRDRFTTMPDWFFLTRTVTVVCKENSLN